MQKSRKRGVNSFGGIGVGEVVKGNRGTVSGTQKNQTLLCSSKSKQLMST